MFGMPRDELLARISSQEITDWIAEFSIRSHEAESRRKQAEMMQKIKGNRLARHK
jgi:hypothetical protein